MRNLKRLYIYIPFFPLFAGFISSPGRAQPIFTRQGDSTFRNLTLKGGVFINPQDLTSTAVTPTAACAGNSGPDAAQPGALGAHCMFMTSTGKQTYLAQYGLNVPANTSGSSAGDQVALYPEVRLNAFSANGWAMNPLIQANKDSGTAIAAEFDLNNLSGCDSTGIDTNATGGSASFVATRSDGSACPQKIGLLVTGVAGNTSSAGISYQYVSDGTHAMWQDGIRLIGGNAIAEYEWVSNTQAPTAFEIKGVHGGWGIDLGNGQYASGALAFSNTPQGKIVWRTDALQASGYTQGYSMAPSSDGTMHFNGPFRVTGTFGVSGTFSGETHFSQSGTFADPDVGVARDAKFGGAGIAVLGGIKTDAIEATNTVIGDTALVAKGVLYANTVAHNGQGRIAFTAPVSLLSVKTAALPTSCTAGSLAFAVDGRKPSEAAGQGSGVLVVCQPPTLGAAAIWMPVTTASAAVAN